MINIIRGPFHSGKSGILLNIVRKEISAGRLPCLIVPSRMQKDLFSGLIAAEKGYAGRIVFTFGEAVETVLSGAGFHYHEISDFESFILLKLLIENNQKSFTYFRLQDNASGVIRLLYSIVTELRAASLLGEEEAILSGFTGNTPQNPAKWHDILHIFREYEKKLDEQKLFDSPRLTLAAAKILQTNGWQNESVLLIDGFFDFTEVQRKFIHTLIKSFESTGREIYLTVPDVASALVQETIQALRNDFQINWLETTRDSLDMKIVEPILAFGKYREVERIANEIIRLKLEENYSYNDVAVIMRNPSLYSGYIQSIFPFFGIPYYNSRDEALKSNPVIIFLYSIVRSALTEVSLDSIEILAIANSNYTVDSEFKPLRNILKIFPSYIKAGKENWKLIISARIEYYKDLLQTKVSQEEADLEIDRIESDLKEIQTLSPILEKLLNLIFTLPESFTPDEFIAWIGSLVRELKIQQTIRKASAGYDRIAAKDFNAFRKLKEALESLKKVLRITGKTVLPRMECFQLFDDLVQDIHYRYEFYPSDAVKILSPFDARESAFRAVFIAGLNEGEFPGKVSLAIAENSEKRRLNDFAHRLVLEDEERQASSEKLDFNLAFSRASERIYLSSTPYDESGREILPSPFLTAALQSSGIAEDTLEKEKVKIFEILPSESWLPIYSLPLLLQNDLEKFPQNILQEYLAAYPFITSSLRMKSFWKSLDTANSYFENKSLQINTEANENFNQIFFGKLDTDKTSAGVPDNLDYIRKKLAQMPFSSSRLEVFGNCRYRFFIQYILQIREEKYPSQEIEPSLKGSFYHAVLKEYIDQTRSFPKEEILSDINKFYGILKECTDRKHLEFLEKEGEKNLFTMEKEYYTKILRDFILFEAEYLRNNEVLESEYPLDLNIPVRGLNAAVPVHGSIDRIDRIHHDGGNTYRIIDYKTGGTKHFQQDFTIPLKLFQGFLYAKAYGKPVDEISYVSIEKNGRDKITDVLPFTCKKSGEENKSIHNFDEIWEQKEKEIKTIFDLIEKGDFSPYSFRDDFPDETVEFYDQLSPDGKIEDFESAQKCRFCPYTSACPRRDKKLSEW